MDLRQQLAAALGNAYRIERELGGGGMSRVFLAEDTSLQRRVVVKVLTPELAAGLNTERFKRETLLSAQLQHPHIVPVLTAGDLGGLPFLIMPYVAGESLRQRLAATAPLPQAEALTILRDVARALAYAHAAGVVHRDIKPDNVLLAEGSAAVTDFGIAKAISSARTETSQETLTIAGTSLGTPAYMAPEQIAADPIADHRCDIYSFGIMAYELLAGRTPFHHLPRAALIAAHLTEAPEPLRDVAPGVPGRLADLVMRCLAKDPAARPQSAREIIEALDTIELSGPQRVPATAPARRRTRRIALVASAALVVLVLSIVIARQPWADPPATLDPAVVAVLPFRVAAADPALHYLQEGMMDLLAAKLTGEGGLRATEPRSVLDEWRRTAPGEARELTPTQTIGIARRVGAGLLLLGDVVGTPTRVTLRGSLLRVPSGGQLVQVSEEGPPDSLAWIIDRFAARLLSEAAGEGAQRLAGLTSTSLSALRSYLDGQSLLRRGQVMPAARAFERALDEDSTFALAGLGLHMATSWYGDPQLGGRGLMAAWRQRHRLSPRDRVLLDALAGPRFPEPSSVQDVFQARQRYAQLAPDRAEAWYLIGDHIFHYGEILEIDDGPRRAYDNFVRASQLDSTYVVGYTHAHMMAVMFGDTAQDRRLERLRLAQDTSQQWHVQHRLYRAMSRGDSAAVRALRDSLGDDYHDMVLSLAPSTSYTGAAAAEVWRHGLEWRERRVGREHQQASRWLQDLALLLGKQSEAWALLEQSFDSTTDINADILRIRHSMMGVGDHEAARQAARRLAVLDAQPIATDSARRSFQRAITRALEPWRLSEGDTTHARRSVERLRLIARIDDDLRNPERFAEIALIEALHAHTVRAANAGVVINRLDSLLRELPYASGSLHEGRATFTNLALARLYEERGDRRRALAAARRRGEWSGAVNPYLSVQLREVGRIAEATGNRELAIRAYRRYLALMEDAEPSLEPEVRASREALARLERAGG